VAVSITVSAGGPTRSAGDETRRRKARRRSRDLEVRGDTRVRAVRKSGGRKWGRGVKNRPVGRCAGAAEGARKTTGVRGERCS